MFILSWRRSLSYRNQSIDLHCELMDWFLYDRDLRHEKVKLENLFFRIHVILTYFMTCIATWKKKFFRKTNEMKNFKLNSLKSNFFLGILLGAGVLVLNFLFIIYCDVRITHLCLKKWFIYFAQFNALEKGFASIWKTFVKSCQLLLNISWMVLFEFEYAIQTSFFSREDIRIVGL